MRARHSVFTHSALHAALLQLLGLTHYELTGAAPAPADTGSCTSSAAPAASTSAALHPRGQEPRPATEIGGGAVEGAAECEQRDTCDASL